MHGRLRSPLFRSLRLFGTASPEFPLRNRNTIGHLSGLVELGKANFLRRCTVRCFHQALVRDGAFPDISGRNARVRACPRLHRSKRSFPFLLRELRPLLAHPHFEQLRKGRERLLPPKRTSLVPLLERDLIELTS